MHGKKVFMLEVFLLKPVEKYSLNSSTVYFPIPSLNYFTSLFFPPNRTGSYVPASNRRAAANKNLMSQTATGGFGPGRTGQDNLPAMETPGASSGSGAQGPANAAAMSKTWHNGCWLLLWVAV